MHSAIWPKDIFSCLNFAAPNCQVTDFDITSGLQCTITTVIITCVACIHHAPTPPDANLNWHGTAEVIARTSPACPPVWYPPPPRVQEPPCARTNPWFRGRILVRKNQPLVPRSNIAGSWTRGGGGGTCLLAMPTTTNGRDESSSDQSEARPSSRSRLPPRPHPGRVGTAGGQRARGGGDVSRWAQRRRTRSPPGRTVACE